MIMVGDPAQLPLVGDTLSPALDPYYLESTFALTVRGYDLTEVVRQQGDSALLDTATALRNKIVDDVPNLTPLQVNHRDIVRADFDDAVAQIVQSVWHSGSIVAVARTNARVDQYNRAVRTALGRPVSTSLCVGERLLVLRNNANAGYQNGDLIEVHCLDSEPEIFNIPYRSAYIRLVFRHASVGLLHQGQVIDEYEGYLLESSLTTREAQLSEEVSWALMHFFRSRNPELVEGSPKFREAQVTDPYLNVQVVKYGYAMTCHKEQGGEWNQVVVDLV